MTEYIFYYDHDHGERTMLIFNGIPMTQSVANSLRLIEFINREYWDGGRRRYETTGFKLTQPLSTTLRSDLKNWKFEINYNGKPGRG